MLLDAVSTYSHSITIQWTPTWVGTTPWMWVWSMLPHHILSRSMRSKSQNHGLTICLCRRQDSRWYNIRASKQCLVSNHLKNSDLLLVDDPWYTNEVGTDFHRPKQRTWPSLPPAARSAVGDAILMQWGLNYAGFNPKSLAYLVIAWWTYV